MKKGFELTFSADKTAVELSLYGSMATSSEFADISSAEVVANLSKITADKLTLLINSPGGDPFAGFAIANRIDKLVADGQIGEVHTVAEGIVASAATIPFLKGDTRTMRNGSRFMIHRARAHVFEAVDSDQLRTIATALDGTNKEAVELYESVSTLDTEQVQTAMASETWYSPGETVEVGFATHNIDAFAVAACATRKYMTSHFNNLPDDIQTLDEIDAREAADRKARQDALDPVNWATPFETTI